MSASPTINLRTEPPAPSFGLMSVELLRAAFEYANMRCTRSARTPTGDGHAVVIFPGLGTDGHSVAPLREFCEQAGYAAYEWGLGRNTGPSGNVDVWLQMLTDHVLQLTAKNKGAISLIGWSLGGIYAREIAKLAPSRIRQVITIGTPFAGSVRSTNVALAYRLLNGNRADLDESMRLRLATAPNVPTTSIYSRSDGIVSWEACMERSKGAQRENIEVQGSHCGLGWNRQVLSVIEDRLGQPNGKWRAYRQAHMSAQHAAAH